MQKKIKSIVLTYKEKGNQDLNYDERYEIND